MGYIDVYAPDHPHARRGFVREHRLVVERILGRYLTRAEIVHHINGDRQDNRPTNLRVTTRSKHARHHIDLPSHGELNGRAVLTAIQVRAIRADDRPCPAIARDYGVSRGMIWRIQRRKAWALLP
jgi:hypothetical protein